MNASNLTARNTRKIEIGDDFSAPRTEPYSSSAASPSSHAEPYQEPSEQIRHDHDLNHPVSAAEDDFVVEGEPAQLKEEIRHLRLAVAQLLARETGQGIQLFRGPVVDNHRLCAIADNLWNHRRWAA